MKDEKYKKRKEDYKLALLAITFVSLLVNLLKYSILIFWKIRVTTDVFHEVYNPHGIIVIVWFI